MNVVNAMMKFVQVVLLSLLAFVAVGTAAARADDNPVQIMQKATDTLLVSLVKEKETLKKDPKALEKLVDENITPYVDAEGIARGVMGQYYRQATDAERQKFIGIFKQSLVRTYAKGLTAYDNQKVVYKPYKPGTDPKKAQVDLDIRDTNGQIFPVTFQMVQGADNAWRVRNIILSGINLGLTFRNQFAAAVESNQGNIGKAVDGWTPDTDSIEKQAKK
jgi:phospholipid transport system substrate-binding protein